ncbi:secretin and TonB N-terminal domain-containing protein [Gloeocapsa sp. PCC 73106]|uniref:secretin and TonB N-terminal domain-containing protein n=1 Tax=Gloeocapsa sp. PCC 73106 TaxID=102232 RepID=UPI0002AC049E|nr:secretin and TonB N-terminal domain-containing protein [Gloeocapsa sp. PCC 73106]ELR98704.1 type II secretory pathway, component HofQ [Gloeocapsa sp. PCC 73106]
MHKKSRQIGILTGTAAICLSSIPIDAAHLLRETEPQLIAQTPAQPEVLVPNPTIVIEDNQSHDGSTATDPTTAVPAAPLPPPAPTPPPFLPRAVAPPVGDIAVSNIDASLDRIELGTSITIPRLVLRDAPVEEVLKLLARNAGLNVIFTDTPGTEGQQINPTISLDLENQSVEDVFNSVLLISGFRANRQGNTIFIGTALPDAARNLISRTLRLNQVDAESAALYLASQGAEVQRIVIPVTQVRDQQTGRIVETIEEAPELSVLTADRPEGATSALLLSGLKASSDDRLNAVNLIGSPRQVEIATAFLVQLDARRRQVSVNVKVIDVNLNNINRFNSSFSFGFDDGFFVQDQGTAILNFGNANPPTATQARDSTFFPTIVPFDNSTVPGIDNSVPFFDRQNAPFDNILRGDNDFTGRATPYARPGFGRNNNPFQPGVSDVDVDEEGFVEYLYELPGLFQYPSRFLLTLEAEVQTGNAKILTDPTLVVQEGQSAQVRLTQQVVASVETEVDALSGVRTTTPVIEDAGLILGVSVERIDDNGFINFVVTPEISAPARTQDFESGPGAANQITLLNKRSLSSGLIRLRDGQTLILSGIIEDSERTVVSKVPILGDIPILGALFRSTSETTDRREVIIMLTPKLVDEDAGYGSNYRPGPDARQMLQQRGFSVPDPAGLEQPPQ